MVCITHHAILLLDIYTEASKRHQQHKVVGVYEASVPTLVSSESKGPVNIFPPCIRPKKKECFQTSIKFPAFV